MTVALAVALVAAAAAAAASPSSAPEAAATPAVAVETSAGEAAATGSVPVATASSAAATPTAAASATPSPLPSPSPTQTPGSLTSPVLFRGSCVYRGGCTVTAVGTVEDSGIRPLRCDASTSKALRTEIAHRYFAPGTMLDLYARGAPAGSFEIDDAQDGGGCVIRASGHKRNTPATVHDFLALLPDDPVRLGALRFPHGGEPDARAIAAAALASAGVKVEAGDVDLDVVRRFREAKTAVVAVDGDAGGRHVVAIAEGNGVDPAAWKIAWSSVTRDAQPKTTLVDAFDLGADGHADVLLETERGEAMEWILLHRGNGTWKP